MSLFRENIVRTKTFDILYVIKSYSRILCHPAGLYKHCEEFFQDIVLWIFFLDIGPRPVLCCFLFFILFFFIYSFGWIGSGKRVPLIKYGRETVARKRSPSTVLTLSVFTFVVQLSEFTTNFFFQTTTGKRIFYFISSGIRAEHKGKCVMEIVYIYSTQETNAVELDNNNIHLL